MIPKKNNNADTGLLGSFYSSSIRNLLPKSSFRKNISSNPKSVIENIENTPPTTHPNVPITHHLQSNPKSPFSHTDPTVKVLVRIRPENRNEKDGDSIIKKVSSDTLCVGDRHFRFDHVFDANSNQEDVFQSVGVPLVRNALAGYNTSILSYGQSGSGKTYTMWGPPSAMVEDPSSHSDQGIVPRIFRMLFSELERERLMSDQKQFSYQCRCSLLEVYNDQIGNLLNPNQKNLEMKDDSKNAVYVENLIEEYVTCYDDVAQILIKGLSSRKIGATSLNSNSSRSHVIFTFVIESLCKGTTKGFASSKASRISLFDLAGLDKDKVDSGNSQCLMENRHVEKSLSQLGHLVDALIGKSQSGENEDIPHNNSCLIRWLQESLGGNANLAVICSISPANKSNDETLCTLKFGEKARSIRNKPVINVIKEADNFCDKIRHLKEELISAKADVHSSAGSKNGSFEGQNVRENLNQFRVGLNRSLLLSNLDNDTDEAVNVNVEDIRQLQQEIDQLNSSCEGNPKDTSASEECVQFYSVEENCGEIEKVEVCYGKTLSKPEPCQVEIVASEVNLVSSAKPLRVIKSTFRDSIPVNSCSQSPILDGPHLSESPKFSNSQRKSVPTPLNYPESCNRVAESSTFGKDVLGKSFKRGEHVRPLLQSSKAESLTASLQRGLRIIDSHQQNSALNKSSTSFSFGRLTLTPCPEIDKVGSYDQTIQQKISNDEVTSTFLCASCKKACNWDSTKVQYSFKSGFKTVEQDGNPDGFTDGNPDGFTDEVPKNLVNAMEKGIIREKELENVCKEQVDRIEQLTQLVVKMKEEKELNFNSVYGHCEEYKSMKDENMLLRGTFLNDYSREECEIKEVEEELAQRDIYFDSTEKESLLEEIRSLRSKLQLYSDAPYKRSTDKLRSSLMSRSIQLQRSGVFSHDHGNEELENERLRWTEMESEWICLTDELRADLESYRQHAEKLEMELKSEKKYTTEMDDALERAVHGHARMVEHYTDLQEKYDDLVAKNEAIMEGIADLKKAIAKASKKGPARFAKSLSAELSVLRVERERESKLLKKENQCLKIQLRDTAEAVQAAGELLVRLREAEQAASVAEENFANVQQDNEELKMQMEKLKRKQKTEINTMKQYLAESKLPESALQPLYREDSDVIQDNTTSSYAYDDQAWRAEFGAIYQEHY